MAANLAYLRQCAKKLQGALGLFSRELLLHQAKGSGPICDLMNATTKYADKLDSVMKLEARSESRGRKRKGMLPSAELAPDQAKVVMRMW